MEPILPPPANIVFFANFQKVLYWLEHPYVEHFWGAGLAWPAPAVSKNMFFF